MEKQCLLDDVSATESWGILTHASKLIEDGGKFSFSGNVLVGSPHWTISATF